MPTIRFTFLLYVLDVVPGIALLLVVQVFGFSTLLPSTR